MTLGEMMTRFQSLLDSGVATGDTIVEVVLSEVHETAATVEPGDLLKVSSVAHLWTVLITVEHLDSVDRQGEYSDE